MFVVIIIIILNKILIEIPEIHQIAQAACNTEWCSELVSFLLMDCLKSLGIVGQTPPTGGICWLDKLCRYNIVLTVKVIDVNIGN